MRVFVEGHSLGIVADEVNHDIAGFVSNIQASDLDALEHQAELGLVTEGRCKLEIFVLDSAHSIFDVSCGAESINVSPAL